MKSKWNAGCEEKREHESITRGLMEVRLQKTLGLNGFLTYLLKKRGGGTRGGILRLLQNVTKSRTQSQKEAIGEGLQFRKHKGVSHIKGTPGALFTLYTSR